jgi:predicted nucleotidyltransferase
MKISLDEQDYEKIKQVAEENNLDLVVIFGSQARGTASKHSDIDIGIYGSSLLDLSDKTNLIRDFSEIFKSDKIDISIISLNSPVFTLQVLTDGKILYEKEKNIFGLLKLRAWKLFAESKPFMDKSYAILKSRIASLNYF